MHATQDRTNARIVPVKFVVAGGFGVGKTTFVGAISEIEPLRTEAAMTSVSAGVDDVTHVGQKTTTTVAMDFGRITVDETLVMYLFGTPGQERFGFMWDDICTGALGAVVLVDTRRIDQCFPAIDYFEAKQIPFVVGVNNFEGAPRYAIDEVREALGIGAARAGRRVRRPRQGEREDRAHHPPREPRRPGPGQGRRRPDLARSEWPEAPGSGGQFMRLVTGSTRAADVRACRLRRCGREAGGATRSNALLTIERVAVLQRVELFSDVPGHMLVAVARLLEEVSFETRYDDHRARRGRGLAVRRRRGPGARPHRRPHPRRGGQGDVVGEFAVLASAPRSASVTAIEPSLLLRLRRGPFEELLDDRPEIARGVISTLVRLLQAVERRRRERSRSVNASRRPRAPSPTGRILLLAGQAFALGLTLGVDHDPRQRHLPRRPTARSSCR